MSSIGHNSKLAPEALRGFVERIERLAGEKDTISEDIKTVYGEAKADGFTPKIMRKLIAARKRDRTAYEEEKAVLDLYYAAMDMDWML